MEMDTDVLFVRPGYLRGVARVIDLWGDLNTYNVSPSGIEADELALQSDVLAISNDLRRAISSVQNKIEKSIEEK